MFKQLRMKIKRGFSADINLKYYILNGILFTFMSTFSRSYGVKFLYRLGGSDFHVSLFNALPGFVALFSTIPGLLWINQSSNKKKTIGSFFIFSRLLTLFFAFVTLLPLNVQPIAFVLLYGFMNFPESVSATALQSYSGDIFNPRERTNAISEKNAFSTLAQLIAFIILGQILGRTGLSNSAVLIRYNIFYIIAFIIGIFEIVTFYKLKPRNTSGVQMKVNMKDIAKKAFRNKKFVIFLLCSSFFHFSWQMGWPLFNIYQINVLGADEKWLMIINITSSIAMFFSYSFWNKLIYKRGNKLAIAFATFGMALTPLLFVMSKTLTVITIMQIATGFFTAGTTTVILSSLLEASPDENRMIYVGIHATCTNLTLSIAPLFSNFLLEYGIIIALVITALLRSAASLAFMIRSKME